MRDLASGSIHLAPWAWYVVALALLALAIRATITRVRDRRGTAQRFRARAVFRGALQRLGRDLH